MPEAPEKIRFRCPHCAVKLAAPAQRAGASMRCPQCKEPLTVPEQSAMPRGMPDPAAPVVGAQRARREWALARCPECDDIIKIRRSNLGAEVRCPECESVLVIDETAQAGS